MKLDDLRRKLYRKDSDEISRRKESEDYYDPSQAEQREDRFGKIEDVIIEKQEEGKLTDKASRAKKRKIILSGAAVLGIITVIVLAIAGYFNITQTAFREEKIEISLEGPAEVNSPEDVSYRLIVENKNRVSLLNVEAVVTFPDELNVKEAEGMVKEGDNRVRIKLGSIRKKDAKEFTLNFGSLSGQDKNLYFDVVIEYRPSNFNSLFTKKYQRSFAMKASPIRVDILQVGEVASGERVELNVVVRNQGNQRYEKLTLELEYPEGFSLVESNPKADSEGRIWNIDGVNAGGQSEIKLIGSVQGYFNTTKIFKAKVYQTNQSGKRKLISRSEGSIEVIAQRVEILQEVSQDNIYAGDGVDYKIRFKNTSTVPLRDLLLTVQLDSRVIDKRKVSVEAGYYDSQLDTITWRAADIPSLKLLQPKEEASVGFALKVIDQLPHQSIRDQNFSISSQASIHSLDVDSPIGQNKKIKTAVKEVKVNSDLNLLLEGSYASNDFENSGPKPLKAEEETTLTLKFTIKNTSNKLKDMVLKAHLPSGIFWKNNFKPDNENIDFNERTGELQWNLGEVKAGTGYYEPKRELIFQIGVKPSENQKGRVVELVKEIMISGQDDFTQKEVEYRFKEFQSKDVSDLGNGIVEE